MSFWDSFKDMVGYQSSSKQGSQAGSAAPSSARLEEKIRLGKREIEALKSKRKLLAETKKALLAEAKEALKEERIDDARTIVFDVITKESLIKRYDFTIQKKSRKVILDEKYLIQMDLNDSLQEEEEYGESFAKQADDFKEVDSYITEAEEASLEIDNMMNEYSEQQNNNINSILEQLAAEIRAEKVSSTPETPIEAPSARKEVRRTQQSLNFTPVLPANMVLKK